MKRFACVVAILIFTSISAAGIETPVVTDANEAGMRELLFLIAEEHAGDTLAAVAGFRSLAARSDARVAATALIHLAYISAMNGDSPGCRLACRELISRYPDSLWRQDAEHLIFNPTSLMVRDIEPAEPAQPDPDPGQKHEAQRLHQLGKESMRLGSYAIAAGYLRRAYAITPDDPKLTFNYASALYMAGRYLEARDIYAVSLRFNASDLEARRFHGLCEWRLGHAEQAIQEWKSILQQAPEDSTTIHLIVAARQACR